KDPPQGKWSYEVKFDGFRILAIKQRNTVVLYSRTRHDLTRRFPEIAQALADIKASDAIIDGEVVALDPQGRSSFQLLQNDAVEHERPPIFYYAFDLLRCEGESLLDAPLEKRRKKLQTILPRKAGIVRYS